MWLTSMLSDSTNGTISSKRVVTLLAFILCSWSFVASVYGYHVDNKLFDSMMYIVIAG